MNQRPVLIVGAGPTGLVLALWLTRLGIRVRIVDKVAEPGTTSRALAVQARTLEFYRQIGLADTLVERSVRLEAVNLWVKGRKVGRAMFGPMGAGLSAFPYVLIFPQDEHERVLIARLAEHHYFVTTTTANRESDELSCQEARNQWEVWVCRRKEEEEERLQGCCLCMCCLARVLNNRKKLKKIFF